MLTAHSDQKKGVFLAVLSALFYSLISVCVKWIGGTLPTMEIVFFRALVMLLLGSGSMAVKHQRPGGRGHLTLLLLRGLSGAMGAFTYYAAIAMIPLTETMALVNLSPFIVSILAALFLKERLPKSHLLALLVSFAGALFIIRPNFGAVSIGCLVAFISAFITGCSYTLVRKLKKDVDTPTIVFYYNVVSVAISLPVMLVKGFVVPDGAEWIKLLCLGLSALLFNYFNTSAYKYAPAGKISLYNYLSIIFSSVFGILIWREYLVLATAAGIALIFAGACLSYHQGRKAPA